MDFSYLELFGLCPLAVPEGLTLSFLYLQVCVCHWRALEIGQEHPPRRLGGSLGPAEVLMVRLILCSCNRSPRELIRSTQVHLQAHIHREGAVPSILSPVRERGEATLMARPGPAAGSVTQERQVLSEGDSWLGLAMGATAARCPSLFPHPVTASPAPLAAGEKWGGSAAGTQTDWPWHSSSATWCCAIFSSHTISQGLCCGLVCETRLMVPYRTAAKRSGNSTIGPSAKPDPEGAPVPTSFSPLPRLLCYHPGPHS